MKTLVKIMLITLVVAVCIFVAGDWEAVGNAFSGALHGRMKAPASAEPTCILVESGYITLSHEWSKAVAVDLNKGQGIRYKIVSGMVAPIGSDKSDYAYQVQDPGEPDRAYGFNQGQTIDTSGHRLGGFRWRTSGIVIKGPVILEYEVYHY
ncbi:MAG: hypothetical protein KGI69_01940 [Patescibacteria group bacterium]|nr:hypothetical protein [Patescibacteria group bacterium]